MDSYDAIVGLGSHAATDLLKLSGVEEDSSIMVGPEFTYFGVFLSALAYKKVNESSLNAGVAALNSLKSIHFQAGNLDGKKLDLIAGLSLAAYDEAVNVWPNTGERAATAITLCDVLARLLKNSAKIELNVSQKAKLRAKVMDLFEILEIAHAEVQNSEQTDNHKSSDMNFLSKPEKYVLSLIDEIERGKSALLTQFDDGDITVQEYHRGIEDLNKKELAIHLEVAKKKCADSSFSGKKVVVVMVFILLIGFLVGAWLYPKLFGYNSAEECVLNTKHKHAVGACYDLYPSIRK